MAAAEQTAPGGQATPEEMAADLRAQETAGAPPAPGSVGVLSPGYVHYGDLVYVPGQLLPPEVAEAFRAQRPEPDRHNVYRLETKPASRRKGRSS
jgi:hypothetical protein